MVFNFFKRKKSKKQELLNKISQTKAVQKNDFIAWLGEMRLHYDKSLSWDDLKNDLENKTKVTPKKLEEFLIQKLHQKEKIKAENKKILEESVTQKLHQKEKIKAENKKILEEKLQSKETKGHTFEKEVVAPWAKKYFKGYVETNIFKNGLSVKRPYEVDVHVTSRKKGIRGILLKDTNDIWIECKNRESSIKRTDIMKLVSAAEDVEAAFEEGREDFYLEKLVFVSVSKYDSDALSYAEEKNVACFQYKNEKVPFKLLNKVDWI
ncbi:MAG: hypothetical protein CVT88_07860 [Candidatus Altiarchaeales archaeon HGW-Altiarchaeales-1]|nr:MAG: hypothetical protein CVT88_07860 [Candidatus Altiarchaeales archaeon HGW-Altiarchaeales-1]